MSDEDVRDGYMLDDSDIKFDKDDNAQWLNVDTSYKSFKNNPINKLLAEFKKEYIKNDRLTWDMFNQLNVLLEEFSSLVLGNPIYKEMEIIRLMQNILDKYQNFMTVMRYNVLLGKEKMIDAEEIIQTEYVPENIMEDKIAELQEKVKDMEEDFWEAKCTDISKIKVIVPDKLSGIGLEDWVRYKKLEAPINYSGNLKRKKTSREAVEDDKSE